MLAAKAVMSEGESSAKQRVTTLTDALEELRYRERKLEEQRHQLELTLAASQEEVKELVKIAKFSLISHFHNFISF